jgi:hypothetical protein
MEVQVLRKFVGSLASYKRRITTYVSGSGAGPSTLATEK